MAKSITYNDLEGTAPLVSVCGVDFEDGKAVEVDDEELAARLDSNAFFEVEGSSKKKRGRPPNKFAEPAKAEPVKPEPDPEHPLAVLKEAE